FAVIYKAWGLQQFSIEVRLDCIPTLEAWNNWKLNVWSAIRDAAETQYNENRQILKQRRDRLVEELGAQDALSLRKIEREEVMKGVLRWMFGPTFEFWPRGVPADPYNPDTGAILRPHSVARPGENWEEESDIWSRVLAHGEMIKFLHHAIEWENMLYFLYPYFWSDPNSRWTFKKYLDHPDPLHRVFLKSGAARVVLTIRPGFEEAFTKFIETGSFFEALGVDHPYISIAQEMENYAKTNYPGIRPANPIEDARPLLTLKQKKAWEDMQVIMKLLDA